MPSGVLVWAFGFGLEVSGPLGVCAWRYRGRAARRPSDLYCKGLNKYQYYGPRYPDTATVASTENMPQTVHLGFYRLQDPVGFCGCAVLDMRDSGFGTCSDEALQAESSCCCRGLDAYQYSGPIV